MADSSRFGGKLSPAFIEELLEIFGVTDFSKQSQIKLKLLGLAPPVHLIEEDVASLKIEGLIRKYDSEEIRQLKIEIKELLEKDTTKALKELKSRLKDDSTLYDDITGLLARYNRIDRYLHKGTIAYADANVEFTKIENSAIMLVNELDHQNLKINDIPTISVKA